MLCHGSLPIRMSAWLSAVIAAFVSYQKPLFAQENANPNARGVRHIKSSFQSGGKKIRIEKFAIEGKEKLPPIILVHESKPMKQVGHVYRAIAARMAEDGFAVFVVHFFDRTGHVDGVKNPNNIQEKDFRAWMATVKDAVAYARACKHVAPKNVGLLGFSLGGFISMAVAAEDGGKNVTCVASCFGGMPPPVWPMIKQLPPLLLIHGRQDKIVGVQQALAIAEYCATNKLSCQCKIYPKEGHLFKHSLLPFILTCRVLGFTDSQAFVKAVRQVRALNNAMGLGSAFFTKNLSP